MKRLRWVCYFGFGLSLAASQAYSVEDSAGVDLGKTGQEWKAIWTRKDKFAALKSFRDAYGLFLETESRQGDISILNAEGACGDSYWSLVKDSQSLSEIVLEVDSLGKVLKEWRPGLPGSEVLRIDKDKLYRKVSYFETISDFDPYKPNRLDKSHPFVVVIQPDNKIDLLPWSNTNAKKWSVSEVKCPDGLKVDSDYKVCVRDKKSKRTFVFERPCS